MNLSTKIILSLSAFVLVALGVWGTVFYYSFMGELTEEMDETLDDYSEDIIIWSLAGEPLPYSDAVAYNTFEIREVTPEYASANNRIRYWESITYIQSQDEDVPARNRTFPNGKTIRSWPLKRIPWGSTLQVIRSSPSGATCSGSACSPLRKSGNSARGR